MVRVRLQQSILDYLPYKAAYVWQFRRMGSDPQSIETLDERDVRTFIAEKFPHLSRFRLAPHLADDYATALGQYLSVRFGHPAASQTPTVDVATRPSAAPGAETVAIRSPALREDRRPTSEHHISPELARRWDSQASGLPQPPDGRKTQEMPVVPEPGQRAGSVFIPPPRPLPQAPSAPAQPGTTPRPQPLPSAPPRPDASPLPRPLPPRPQTPPAPVAPPPPSRAATPGTATQVALQAAADQIDSSPTGDPRMTQQGAAAPGQPAPPRPAPLYPPALPSATQVGAAVDGLSSGPASGPEPLPRFTYAGPPSLDTGSPLSPPAPFPIAPPPIAPPAPVAPPPAPAAAPAAASTSSPRVTSAVTRDLPAQAGTGPSSPVIPPPPPTAPAAVAPSAAAAPAQSGTMSENVFMANYQRLQAHIGNVHLAFLTGLRGDAPPVEMTYGLLINESVPSRQGMLESNIAVAPYKLRFIISAGGVIRRIDLLNPELNPYAQIITRLADEYNVDQMEQLEYHLSGDPSIDDEGRRRLGDAIFASREYATIHPRVLLFGESSGETSEIAVAARRDSGPPPVEQASIVPPEAAAVAGGMRVIVWEGPRDQVTGNTPPAGPIPPARPVAVGSHGEPRRILPETFTAPPAGTRASTPPATDADPFASETPRIRSSAINLANTLRTAGSAQARLAAWQNIQIQYLSLLGKLVRLIETESVGLSLPGAFGVQSRQAILSMAKNTDIFAGIVFTTAWDVTKPFASKPKTAEQAFLLTQMKMISEIRKSVAELAKIIDPSRPSTPAQVSEAVSATQTGLEVFNNPIAWTDKFLTTIREFGGKFSRRLARVTSSTQGNWSNVEFQKPQQYIDLIGKMLLFVSDSHWSRFFRIRNRKIKLNFEWVRTPAVINKKGVIKKPEEMKLVVSSRSYDFGGWFRGMRWHADGLRQLVNEMGGEWHNPNRIGRTLRLLLAFIPAVRRSRAHRLIVPISIVQEGGVVVSGSGMPAPPAPASGSPATGATPSTVTGLVSPEALGETIVAGHPVDPSISTYSHSQRSQQAQRRMIQQRQGWVQNAQRTWGASAAAAAVRVPVRVR